MGGLMKTLCVLNKKGGVGKTTIASNLAQGLSLLGKKILVIDDEPHILLMVSQRLKANQYEVITALSGEQGLKRAVQDIPDIVLLDHVMPDMDGDEVLERLKKNPVTRSIPILMFPADVKEVKVGDYLERGAVGCVYKPFVPEDLLARIREVLDGKE